MDGVRMDGVRHLLWTNLDLIDPDDRPKIEVAYELRVQDITVQHEIPNVCFTELES